MDIAAHGELDAADPLASALVLSPTDGDDGRLELREVFALSPPGLVTLSACDSASSDLSGDEWVGLAQAFLTAGSRTVIAAQGRVADLSAAVLMKRFYRGLGSGSRAEALRQAALFTRGYFAHPSHWATFGLWGDFR
jgi:CHAT domain-containing protein